MTAPEKSSAGVAAENRSCGSEGAAARDFDFRIGWAAAALITVALLWLHFHFWRNAGGLWRDEVNLVNLARAPTLAAMQRDSFPILMPGLVKIWSRLAQSDASLRLLGVICGLALPAAFWVAAGAARRPPLFSLVLFGLNPLFICYGDSLRAYGLGAALIVFALAAMWSFLKKPTWPRAGVLAFVAALSAQALYQNAILFLAVCLGGFAVCWQRRDFPAARKIFCAGLVAAFSLLPYSPNVLALPPATMALRRGFSPFTATFNFAMAAGFPFAQFTVVWKMLALAVAGLAVLSLGRSSPDRKSGGTILPLLAGVTIVAVTVLFLGFLRFAAAGARPWYFLPPLALAAVCFDFGISFSSLPRLGRAAVFGFLAGTALVALPLADLDLRGHFTNVDKLAARLKTEASPQDFIVVTPWFYGISFGRYFPGAAPWETLPPLADHSTHRYDLVLERMKDTNSIAPVLQKISGALRSGHRVWVVGLLNLPPASAGEPPVLPPPPLASCGWSDTPYVESWAARTGFFLARHSVEFTALPNADTGAVYYQEDFHLFVAKGWRD